MKRILSLLVAAVVIVATAYSQTVVMSELPSDKQYRKAVQTLMYKTNGHDITPKRMKAMEEVQSVMNRFTNSDWKAYRAITDVAESAKAEQSGVPYYLRQAANKVCKEVRTTKVKEGTVAVWLLYNMGYIVKTPTAVFGVDIYTKYVDEVADLIDFVMITHRHGDHCYLPFLRAMTAKGKAVYAAFELEGVDVTKVEHGALYEVGSVKFRTTLGDHNKKLRNYVASYEINCGVNTNNTIIYHTGDSNNYKQLLPEQPVDIFIFHMAVGLNMQAAIDQIQPRLAFLSHNQELGHRIDKWRWTFHDALKIKNKLRHDHLWIPCWGERVVYNRKDWQK